MHSNLKPADELASIRQKIKDLKACEKELRAGMLDGSIGLSGEYTNARFVTRTSKRLNRKLLEEELGDISRFMVETETKYLKLEDRDDGDDWQVIE